MVEYVVLLTKNMEQFYAHKGMQGYMNIYDMLNWNAHMAVVMLNLSTLHHLMLIIFDRASCANSTVS